MFCFKTYLCTTSPFPPVFSSICLLSCHFYSEHSKNWKLPIAPVCMANFHPWRALCGINNFVFLLINIWNPSEQKNAESNKKKAKFLRTWFHFVVFIYGKHRKMFNKYLQNRRTVLRHLRNELGTQKISTKVKAMLNNTFAISVQLFPITVMRITSILQNSQGISYFYLCKR